MPYLVDPVEVGRAREQQAVGGVVEEAVEGDGGGQQDIGVGMGRTLQLRAQGS